MIFTNFQVNILYKLLLFVYIHNWKSFTGAEKRSCWLQSVLLTTMFVVRICKAIYHLSPSTIKDGKKSWIQNQEEIKTCKKRLRDFNGCWSRENGSRKTKYFLEVWENRLQIFRRLKERIRLRNTAWWTIKLFSEKSEEFVVGSNKKIRQTNYQEISKKVNGNI